MAVVDLCRHRSPGTTLRYYAGVNKERSKEKHKEILGKMLNGGGLASVELFREGRRALGA